MSENNSNVDLETFISSTLVQITRAVKRASDEITDMGGIVTPRVRGGPSTAAQAGHLRSPRRIPVTLVEFNIAITASSGDAKEAKIGVLSGIFNAGVEGKDQSSNEKVSRLSFSVPLELPSTEPYKYDPKSYKEDI